MSTLLDRRTVIAGLAATFASRAKATEPRVAVIDWAMLETVLALGVTPVAATELIQFRDIAVEPVVPAEVADLGLRGVPNYELLRITAPDLILISNFYEPQRDKLERAAPVLSFSIYLPGRAPFAPAADAMLKLGARLDRAAQAERAIATTYAELARSSSARGLGLAPGLLRLVLILVAVGLATVVVAQVGVIGFIGLAAPALATLSGARTLIQRLIAAPLVGAILLLLTDGFVQLIFTGSGERVPTGAATALLGGPLLLWLLPRLRMIEWPSPTARPSGIRRSRAPWRVIGALTIVAGVCAVLAMMLGRGPAGWSFATGDLLVDLAALRGPRVIVALAAGCALAASGVVIQRVTGNPLASPEILGAGSGAGVGLAVVLFAMSAPGLGEQLVGSALGAVVVLGVILAVARGSHFGPERVLFAGIAMGALCSAVLTAVIATGSREAFTLLRWISGSTNDAGPAHAWLAVIATFVLVVPLLTVPRWLQILPLGDVTAASLGLPVRAARLLLVLIAGLLAAVASLFVGPLSFIGLIAPHLARLLGLGRAQHQLVAALAIGAALMVMSDWLSRMVAFPYQLPLGLFASMLGGLYLIWLLGHGREQHG